MKALEMLKERMRTEVGTNLVALAGPENLPFVAHLLVQELYQVVASFLFHPVHAPFRSEPPPDGFHRGICGPSSEYSPAHATPVHSFSEGHQHARGVHQRRVPREAGLLRLLPLLLRRQKLPCVRR